MRKKRQPHPLDPGNRTFFQDFYEQYKDFLFYMASQYAATRSEREDLAQEALVRLIRNTDTLRTLTHAQRVKYIQLTVKALWLDQRRSRDPEDLLFLDQAMTEASRDPEPATAAGEAVNQLRQAMRPRDWMALEGKYLLGYTHEELADLLDMDPNTLRSAVSRARKRARKILEDLEKEEV